MKRVSEAHHIVQARLVTPGTLGFLELSDDLITIAEVDRPACHVLEPLCGIQGRLCRKRFPDRRSGDGAGGVEVCDFVDFAPARFSSALIGRVPDEEPFGQQEGNSGNTTHASTTFALAARPALVSIKSTTPSSSLRSLPHES